MESHLATPIIPWIGGKRRLADLLLSRFPAHSCYVELFAGGAALYQAFGGKVSIEQLDWAECVQRYDRPHTLFYADPPYWQTEGYGVDFAFDQYERMAELMRGLQGKMLVSINDHPDIRRVFDGFEMEALDIQYTVGGGGRQAARKELIVYSWDRAAEPAGLF